MIFHDHSHDDVARQAEVRHLPSQPGPSRDRHPVQLTIPDIRQVFNYHDNHLDHDHDHRHDNHDHNPGDHSYCHENHNDNHDDHNHNHDFPRNVTSTKPRHRLQAKSHHCLLNVAGERDHQQKRIIIYNKLLL